jgi:hypothetical protein
VDEDEGASVSQVDYEADYDTINDALNAGEDCIVVGPGTYYEIISLDSDVLLTGAKGPEETIISGLYDEGPVISLAQGVTNDTVISGFTLQEGTGYIYSYVSGTITYEQAYGGGLYVNYATPVLKNLIVTNNKLLPYYYDSSSLYQTSYGGGGYFRSYPTNDEVLIVEDVEFTDNRAYNGADAYIYGYYGSSEFRRIWAHDSYSDGSGGSIYVTQHYSTTGETRELLLENVIVNSFQQLYTTSSGAIQLYYSTANLNNVAIVDVQALSALYVYNHSAYSTPYITMRNSVLANNDTTYGIYVYSTGTEASQFDISYSALYEPDGMYDSSQNFNYADNSNLIGDDPAFDSFSQDGDGTNDTLTLDSNSPLIDAGHPNSAYTDPDGSRNDIGPYGGPEATW